MTTPSKLAKNLLVLFACLHFLLAIGFALKTPYRTGGFIMSWGRTAPTNEIGAPDERQHANYIGYLLKEHKLPSLDPKSSNLGEEYESHQPPLYYAAAAATATVTGQSDPESHSFGTVIRVLNCLIGAAGVVGVFFAAMWTTKRDDIAILSAAFAAFLPMNCALSGAISNDPLLITLISWSFAFAARSIGSEDQKEIAKSLLFSGILAGLACTTKSSGLVALVGFFATAFMVRKHLPISKIAGLCGISVLIALPIWLRNISIYGDPLAQKVFKESFGGSAQKSQIIATIEYAGAPGSPEVQYWMNWVGYWAARSYIGVFGVMDIWLNSSGKANSNVDPNWLYKGLIAFIAIAKVGFLVYLRKDWKSVPKAIWIGLIIALLTVLVFIGFNMTYFQAQGRYLLPCLAPSAIILALGWTYLLKGKATPAIVAVVLLFGGTTLYGLSQLSSEFAIRQTSSLSPQ